MKRSLRQRYIRRFKPKNLQLSQYLNVAKKTYEIPVSDVENGKIVITVTR